MANWKHYDNEGGVLVWHERNDTIINNGEDFVCYSFHPIDINMDVVVGDVECISYQEYKNICPEIRYSVD